VALFVCLSGCRMRPDTYVVVKLPVSPVPGAFLAAAVWGGHICIGGGQIIPDDIMHD